ncbi:Hypothetical protein D9617_4g002540 [Elsinoe fawcettii]|nr:Hypothetical protein D9617_4g002540 [Elsinoe fawcettii]
MLLPTCTDGVLMHGKTLDRNSSVSNQENKRDGSAQYRLRGIDLSEIYSENVLAKILQVARRGLEKQAPLPAYPHTVPQSGPEEGQYELREADFWTCGFFPGCIYALLERSARWPAHFSPSHSLSFSKDLHEYLLRLGRHWSVAIEQMSSRTDTHDMGFIVQPALQMDWELTGHFPSLQAVSNAAHALASRWSSKVGAIRSWDRAINYRYSYTDKDADFLVIIDSMCNLDLLYTIGHRENNQKLIDIATTHAHTIRETILRDDFSSYHLVNFDPKSGNVEARMTNQGWKDESCWTRGQAWAVMGFAQTYQWTRDIVFLQTAIGCASYFLRRLRESRHHHPLVPVWDFDAPQDNPQEPLRDTSAAVIVANGFLIIHEALQSLGISEEECLRSFVGEEDFLQSAIEIVQETIDMSLDQDFARLNGSDKSFGVSASKFDAILRNATTNNNEHAHQPYTDHGLVYADYYFLEFGNKLLRMGLL